MTDLFRRREDGQMTLPVLLLSLAILAATIGGFIVAEAVDTRTRAQKGADAAALAAARDVRDDMIWTFSRGHIVASPVGPITRTTWPTAFGISSMSGSPGATDFARRNDTTLSSYRPGVQRITTDVTTSSKVESPVGRKAQKTLTGEATATAQIDSSGIRCRHHTVVRESRTRVILSWKVTCRGNGSVAHASYTGPTALSAVITNEDAWRKLFDIRLVD